MPESQLKCARCQGSMDLGFVVDRGLEGLPTRERWVEGAAEKSIWTGLKTKDRTQLDVITYRCQQCGYLESYANGEPSR